MMKRFTWLVETAGKTFTIGLVVVTLGVLGLAVLSPQTHAQIRPTRSNDVAISCNNSVVINQATGTTTELVPLVAGQRIYVCGFVVNQVGAATAATVKFVTGTGAACATNPVNKTGVMSSDVGVGVATNIAYGGGVGMVFAGALGEALCITTTTTQAQKGVLTYAQF